MENNPKFLDEIRRSYPWILVDEFQDTDAVQDRILRLLAGDGKRFTAVGDDDQSIYRFRGATVRNILAFKERFPGSKLIKLERNFRSKKPIVQNSQQVIVHNPARVPKDLSSARGIGSDVLVVSKRSLAEEAKASVGLLKRLHRSGKIARFGDIAILFRSVRYHAGYYIDALPTGGEEMIAKSRFLDDVNTPMNRIIPTLTGVGWDKRPIRAYRSVYNL